MVGHHIAKKQGLKGLILGLGLDATEMRDELFKLTARLGGEVPVFYPLLGLPEIEYKKLKKIIFGDERTEDIIFD